MADLPPKSDPPATPATLQFTMDENVANGAYVNFANIIHNPAEFVFDFGRLVPGRPEVRVLSRILTSPIHAKQFLEALAQNIAMYEKSFGQIRTDFDPARADREGVRPN
jgi:hypothetical protein